MVVRRRPTYQLGEHIISDYPFMKRTEVVAKSSKYDPVFLVRSLHSKVNGPHTFCIHIDD